MEIGRTFSWRRLAAGTAATSLAAAGLAGVMSLSGASAADTPQATSGGGAGVALVAPGSGTLYYDWGCDGTYDSVSITFNANGTFSSGSGSSGQWVRIGGTAAGSQAGMLMFQYDNVLDTTYSSVTTADTATGVQSTFSGLNGCHHVLGSGLAAAEQKHDETFGPDGTPIKR